MKEIINKLFHRDVKTSQCNLPKCTCKLKKVFPFSSQIADHKCGSKSGKQSRIIIIIIIIIFR